MDNYSLLTKKLIELNNGSFVTDLICEPTKSQMNSLIEGSGSPIEEMCQVNSSAGLAVNFWRAFELSKNSRVVVDFEWKKRKPLKNGYPANIDVVVYEDALINHVESKFLEPYYSENEKPRDAYFDVKKYSSYTKDSADSWVGLFKETKDFKYYNVTQLCRHLLAISKDIWNTPKDYQNKSVGLISATWDMPDSFINLFSEEIAEGFEKRRKLIREEADRSVSFLNDFIRKHLHFIDFEYQAVKYNNIVSEISDPQILNSLKRRYFL